MKIKKMNINELKNKAYKCACEHGFHDEELSNEHLYCLVISELMEAVEADRKGKYFPANEIDEYASLQKDNFHVSAFKNYIKDTVEDELADAAIRLLDLYGLRKIELDECAFNDDAIQTYAGKYQDKSFTESMYYITYSVKASAVLPEMLLEIFGIAKHLNIDLLWHIEQKMKYNQLREKMHGKKY